MGQKFLVIAIFVVLSIVASSVIVWMILTDIQNAVKHETDRWAVIQDINGDMIAVEPTSNTSWHQLVELSQNRTRRWIGSIVIAYDNKWGFRFKPENLTIAEVTAEGLQATIKQISADLDYWFNKWAYVDAKVTETHDI